MALGLLSSSGWKESYSPPSNRVSGRQRALGSRPVGCLGSRRKRINARLGGRPLARPAPVWAALIPVASTRLNTLRQPASVRTGSLRRCGYVTAIGQPFEPVAPLIGTGGKMKTNWYFRSAISPSNTKFS
jgi:hypothetical protein